MDSQQEKIPHRGDHSTSGSVRIRAPTVAFVVVVFAVVNFVVVFFVVLSASRSITSGQNYFIGQTLIPCGGLPLFVKLKFL